MEGALVGNEKWHGASIQRKLKTRVSSKEAQGENWVVSQRKTIAHCFLWLPGEAQAWMQSKVPGSLGVLAEETLLEIKEELTLLHGLDNNRKLGLLTTCALLTTQSKPEPKENLPNSTNVHECISGLPWWLRWWKNLLQCRRLGFDPPWSSSTHVHASSTYQGIRDREMREKRKFSIVSMQGLGVQFPLSGN